MNERQQKAHDLAFAYERDQRCCAQSTLRALMEAFDMEDPDAYQAMAGFSGGGGCLGDASCGAYIAGVYFIGMHTGRRPEHIGCDPDDPRGSARNRENFEMVQRLNERFIREYGTVSCHQIHRKLYGRPFFIVDPDEKQKFDEAGAHSSGCTSVCAKGALWAAELVEEFIEELRKEEPSLSH